MDEVTDDFLVKLRDKLSLRATWLETTELQALRADLRTLRTLFGSMVGTLLKKGQLREDPYDYEGRPTEIATPPDSHIPDRAESDVVGSRLTAYRRQLDFLVDGDLVRLETLDLATLSSLGSLISYIDWANFGEATHSPTTRAFARLVAGIRMGADPLAAKVVHESLSHIQALVVEIRAHVSQIESWQRESWKAEVRTKVLPLIKPHGVGSEKDRGDELLAIKRTLEKVLQGAHWWPELAKEILEDEYSEDSTARKQKLLSSLELPPTAGAEPAAGKKELIAAIRGLSQVAQDIAAAETILVENEHVLEKRALGFLQRLRRLFQRRLGRLDDRFYEINLPGSSKEEPRRETIDFLHFVAELREMQEILRQVTGQSGSEGHRIDSMTEEELCDFLDWQLAQIRDAHRRMESLNELFQIKAVHERRGISVHSIKFPLLRIENALARADEARRPVDHSQASTAKKS